MRRFKFDRPLVESPYPPKSINVLWVDVNESTGEISTIKLFKKGQWIDYMQFVPEPEIPKPVTRQADNEIWYTTNDGQIGLLPPDEYYPATGETFTSFDRVSNDMGIELVDHIYSTYGKLIFAEPIIELGGMGFVNIGGGVPDTNISELILPNSVKIIDTGSMLNMKNLTKLTIPATLSEIKTQEGQLESTDTPFGNGYPGDEKLFNNLNNIIFQGTVAQWNKVIKGENWSICIPATYVQCSDGQVTL